MAEVSVSFAVGVCAVKITTDQCNIYDTHTIARLSANKNTLRPTASTTTLYKQLRMTPILKWTTARRTFCVLHVQKFRTSHRDENHEVPLEYQMDELISTVYWWN
jgi:hypothetical protein